jgi:hypothetical protein
MLSASPPLPTSSMPSGAGAADRGSRRLPSPCPLRIGALERGRAEPRLRARCRPACRGENDDRIHDSWDERSSARCALLRRPARRARWEARHGDGELHRVGRPLGRRNGLRDEAIRWQAGQRRQRCDGGRTEER